MHLTRLAALAATIALAMTAPACGGDDDSPIAGGIVTYYEPGSVSPFVQGTTAHAGSGLSLAGGGKTVELTDFVVDPGKSVLTGKVTVDGEVAVESAPLFSRSSES
jgi:hypothetical protein